MLPATSLADLAAMTREQRAAFAAGCAERVYDLYEQHARPERDHVWQAITLAWEAPAGNVIPGTEADRLVAALDQESGDYCNVADQTLEMPFEVIVAARYALETAHSGDPHRARDAANAAVGAVGRTDQGRSHEDGVAEELAWQLDWLRFCQGSDPRTSQQELKRRTAAEPAWYLRWIG